MAGAIERRGDFTGEDLRRPGRSGRDAKQVRRLLALAVIGAGGRRTEASPIGGGPRAPHERRTARAYPFGAVCPAEGRGAGSVMPFCDTEAMQAHLAEIGAMVAPDAHAVPLLDQAGWHFAGALNVPENITLLPLPPRSPELNPVENVWQFMRDNRLSNRVFSGYDDIAAHCCAAWNGLLGQPSRLRTIGRRSWAEGV